VASDSVATDAAGSPVLSVRGLVTSLRKGRRKIALVRGVDLDLHAGRTTVLLGESGSGKSVLARSILRLTPPEMEIEGTVEHAGADLLSLPERQLLGIRGAKIALIPQDPSAALNPYRRVGAQIREVLRIHRIVSSKAEANALSLQLLEQAGIPDPPRVARAWPHELSGGMKQRVAIAIGISCRPDVLIADEPTTALDVTVQDQILRLIAGLQRDLGMAVLLITHDVNVARDIADDVAVMYGGVIVERGRPAEVLRQPAHPYPKALLGALPERGRRRGALVPILGQPPDPTDENLVGCRFAPRCVSVVTMCSLEEPTLEAVSPQQPNHDAACWVVAAGAGDPS
jgi:oligopeptide/dipeptide ABC transporter ATP-binding protein